MVMAAVREQLVRLTARPSDAITHNGGPTQVTSSVRSRWSNRVVRAIHVWDLSDLL